MSGAALQLLYFLVQLLCRTQTDAHAQMSWNVPPKFFLCFLTNAPRYVSYWPNPNSFEMQSSPPDAGGSGELCETTRTHWRCQLSSCLWLSCSLWSTAYAYSSFIHYATQMWLIHQVIRASQAKMHKHMPITVGVIISTPLVFFIFYFLNWIKIYLIGISCHWWTQNTL